MVFQYLKVNLATIFANKESFIKKYQGETAKFMNLVFGHELDDYINFDV